MLAWKDGACHHHLLPALGRCRGGVRCYSCPQAWRHDRKQARHACLRARAMIVEVLSRVRRESWDLPSCQMIRQQRWQHVAQPFMMLDGLAVLCCCMPWASIVHATCFRTLMLLNHFSIEYLENLNITKMPLHNNNNIRRGTFPHSVPAVIAKSLQRSLQ